MDVMRVCFWSGVYDLFGVERRLFSFPTLPKAGLFNAPPAGGDLDFMLNPRLIFKTGVDP